MKSVYAIWCAILCAVSVSSFGADKFIRLRNETIRTPDRPQLRALNADDQEPKSGLWLIQFTGPALPEWREQLAALKVELVRPVPEDAFVASLQNVTLGSLKQLPFVRWVGPFKPTHKVHERLVNVENGRSVRVLLKPGATGVERLLATRGIPRARLTSSGRFGGVLEATVTARQLEQLANSTAVLWIEPAPAPKLFDAIAAQIVAGPLEGGTSTATHALGFDGEGVTVSVADSGLMEGTLENMHADLAGRVIDFFHYGELEDGSDEHSHGTHVTGIIAGNGATGETDEEGYLYGLGIAPKVKIVSQRIFDGLGGYHAPPSSEILTRNAVQTGAEIGSNSWGDDTQGRYDISAMEFDALVRDADAQTPGDQPYILEFSAGNAGPGARTIGSPAVGKNVIASGASQNNRPEFLLYAEGENAMADFSSRGPAEDGRIKPDVVAPGTWIASLQSSFAGDENAWLPISPNYIYQGGTSQSGPQVSGAAAVFVQYYRETHQGETPSPALVKAALINSATDMLDEDGTRPTPNHEEGWGRIDLPSLIGSEANHEFIDQLTPLATAQVYEKRTFIADPTLPVKVTMVYTDVPGFPGTIPALVNDLDLEVVSPSGVQYRGNQFLNGESIGGAPSSDTLNNVEGVHLSLPEAGEYIIRVRARSVSDDARRDTPAVDQDFALVVSGGVPFPGEAYVALDRLAYTVPSTASIRVIDFDQVAQSSVNVTVSTATEPVGLNLTLQASGTIGVFTGAVQLAAGPPVTDGFVQAANGDLLQVRYADASSATTVVGTATIDTVAPTISNLSAINEFGLARVELTTDEPARAIVEFGTDRALGSAVTNVAYRTSQQVHLPALVVGQTYFFRVTAEDRAGNRRMADNNGQLFSFVAEGAPPVLLVDAYKHGPDDEGPEIPATAYTDALDSTEIEYDVWNVSQQGSPPLTVLNAYRVVIWRINDSFYDDTSFAPDQENSILQYVNGGGSFFMASMEILSRLGPSPITTNLFQVAEFMTNTDPFGDCPECDEDHGAVAINGANHDPITSGVSVSLDYSNYPAFEFDPIFIGPDVSDTFVPSTNAVSILTEPGGRTVGIRWPRNPTDGDGRVVFLSVPLDGIPADGVAPNNRAAFLRKALGFLAPGLNGIANISLDSESYSVPSQVTIELGDSDQAGAGQTSVRVFTESSPDGVLVSLPETVRPGIFRGFAGLVAVGQAPDNGQVRAADGETLSVEYADVSADGVARVTASVDTVQPLISDILAEPEFEDVLISWVTDQPSDSLVQYGESSFLGRTAYGGQMTFDHELLITGLQPGRPYFYQVVSRDEAGNTVVDDNNGDLYTFDTRTPLSPPFFDDLETGADNWDFYIDEEIGSLGWELGSPDNGIASEAHSGQNAWGTNLRGEFFDAAHMFLISPSVHLNGGSSALLRFAHNYDFTAPSTFEYAQLLLFTNALTQPITLREYNEFTIGWEEEVIDLSPHIGRVVQIVWEYLIFDLEESGSTHHGWLVDDVSLVVTNIARGTLTVTNNLAQASFQIRGPSAFSGAGSSFVLTNAAVGEYVIQYEPVPYYITPAPQTNTLQAAGALHIRGNYTFPDANGNQISDLWEDAFPRNNGDPMRRDDADGDGASDYAEFVAGTNPLDAESSFHLLTPMPIGNNRVQLRWSSAPGRNYRLVGSSDGITWTTHNPATRATASEASFTVNGLPTASTLFRVEVTP